MYTKLSATQFSLPFSCATIFNKVIFKNNPPTLENYIKIILIVNILADPKLPMLAKDLTNLSEFAVDTPCSI